LEDREASISMDKGVTTGLKPEDGGNLIWVCMFDGEKSEFVHPTDPCAIDRMRAKSIRNPIEAKIGPMFLLQETFLLERGR
jgi:hypothetical protein